MKSSTRFGLVGVGALSLLSLVHWARRSRFEGPEIVEYLMGVLPNAAAAVAIPYVVLSIWADQKPGACYSETRRVFGALTLFSGACLIAWEFMQKSSGRLVFDVHDIGATVLGLCLGWMLFAVLTPKASARAT